jgi:hypothetical protein
MAWFFLNLLGALASGYLLGGLVHGVSRRLPLILPPLFLFSLATIALGQTSILVFFLLVLSWSLLEARRDWTAGAVLAWLTVKPQLSIILLLALLGWLIRQRRWNAVKALVGMGTLLLLGSTLAAPSWPLDWVNTIRQTQKPTEFYPWIGNAWLLVLRALGLEGLSLAAAYLALALPFLAVIAWAAWRPAGKLEEVFSLGILGAFFIMPYARHYDFVILLIPLLVALGRMPRLAAIALAILVMAGPYIQFNQLVEFKQRHNPSTNFLVESTFFWVPLLLAAVWAWCIREQVRRALPSVTEARPRP